MPAHVWSLKGGRGHSGRRWHRDLGGGGDCWLDRLDFPIPNVCKGQQQQQLLFKRTMTFHCVWLAGFTLFSRTRTAGIRSRRSDWSCSLCVRKRCRRPFTCEEFRYSSSRRWSSRSRRAVHSEPQCDREQSSKGTLDGRKTLFTVSASEPHTTWTSAVRSVWLVPGLSQARKNTLIDFSCLTLDTWVLLCAASSAAVIMTAAMRGRHCKRPTA